MALIRLNLKSTDTAYRHKLKQAHTDQQADCCSCNSYLLRCFLAFAQQNDPSTTYQYVACAYLSKSTLAPELLEPGGQGGTSLFLADPLTLSQSVHTGRYASFLCGGFITVMVVNSLERKLAKRTSVQWGRLYVAVCCLCVST